MIDLKEIILSTDNYNFHAHSQFCDGRDSMADIAAAAADAGMKFFAFTPHSPINVYSTCNMSREDVPEYINEMNRLKDIYFPGMQLMTSMEIDYTGDDWGPHIDYFQNMPLDFRLGSVHFVPNQNGILIDCDGSFGQFSQYLKDGFGGDIRYVVEKYFEQVLRMLERGGVNLLGHFDKISGNASMADPEIENQRWYESLIDDVISHVTGTDVVVEINTKALVDRRRFYPSQKWWKKLIDADIPIAVDSDAHYASKVTAGREEALSILSSLK